MTDIAKIQIGLEAHEKGCGYRSHHCDTMECPYRYGDEGCDIEELCKDANYALDEQKAEIDQLKAMLEESSERLEEMIKKREPTKPKVIAVDSLRGYYRFVCGVCGLSIFLTDKYCRNCGRKLKWE